METIDDIKRRVETTLEEKEARVSRLREILNSPDPPKEDDIEKEMQYSKRVYSIVKNKRTREEQALCQMMGDSSEALRKGDFGAWLRSKRRIRDKRKEVSSLGVKMVTMKGRMEECISHTRFGPVTTFMKAMAPLRLKELEEEMDGARQTLRDIDQISNSKTRPVSEPRRCGIEVDLTCEDSSGESH